METAKQRTTSVVIGGYPHPATDAWTRMAPRPSNANRCSVSAAAVEHPTQLFLGPFQQVAARLRQPRAAAIDMEFQHGHCGAKRFGRVAMAAFGGALEKKRNLTCTALFDYAASRSGALRVRLTRAEHFPRLLPWPVRCANPGSSVRGSADMRRGRFRDPGYGLELSSLGRTSYEPHFHDSQTTRRARPQ